MQKLQIKLENCYGIKKLEKEFDFSKSHVISIYAQNASMKTSFAKTFYEISKDGIPRDDLHNLKSKFNIEVDGNKITEEKIFVIEALREDYYQDEKAASTLLVNKKGKSDYEKIQKNIEEKKTKLINTIKKKSGTKTDTEDLISKDFNESNIYKALFGLSKSKEKPKEDFSEIKYGDIFNPHVIKMISESSVVENLEEYFKKYNAVIKKYDFFVEGGFNPTGAESVFSTLDKESFFNPEENTLNLKGEDGPLDKEHLRTKLDEIKNKISKNTELKNISNLIVKNVNVKKFQNVVENNPSVLVNLKPSEVEGFKKNLWKSYLMKEEDLMKDFSEAYSSNIDELKKIEKKASEERTLWEETIEIFRKRFFPPFYVFAKNKKNAILGKELLNIAFGFKDENGKLKEFSKRELDDLRILSQGEKRIIYLLYVIFEIKKRELEKQETLFIIDDIADSFDYKNKYAIIHYLKEISENELFYQIILTHNFDFFRTIFRRFGNIYENFYLANRDNGNVKLQKIDELSIIDPFKKYRQECHEDIKKFLSLVPFVRNIIQYAGGEPSHYKTLTNLLHFRKDSLSIKIKEVKDIFDKYIKFNLDLFSITENLIVVDEFFKEANKIKKENIDLDCKIILSIAIRLKAEKFIKEKMKDDDLDNKKTYELIDCFKKKFESLTKEIEILDAVQIMTPENIHMNTFMYEPILDMSSRELKKLYIKISDC